MSIFFCKACKINLEADKLEVGKTNVKIVWKQKSHAFSARAVLSKNGSQNKSDKKYGKLPIVLGKNFIETK